MTCGREPRLGRARIDARHPVCGPSAGRCWRTKLRALIRYLVLPTLPAGSRAAVRELFPEVRGGRGRSSADRASCRLQIGLLRANVRAVRKQDADAIRRFGHTHRYTPHALGVPSTLRRMLRSKDHILFLYNHLGACIQLPVVPSYLLSSCAQDMTVACAQHLSRGPLTPEALAKWFELEELVRRKPCVVR